MQKQLLTDSEMGIAVNCLRVAGEKFAEDAKMFRKILETPEEPNQWITHGGAKRLAEQFDMQSKEAFELCDKLQDCVDVEVIISRYDDSDDNVDYSPPSRYDDSDDNGDDSPLSWQR